MTSPSSQSGMQPIREDDLPDVAEFLEQTHRENPEASAAVVTRNTKAQLLRRLRWRLVDHPGRRDDIELGQCLRTDAGTLAGVNLQFPAAYRLGAQRLIGLCGWSFYVDAAARLQGFFMFRRFLATPGVDFCLATTCGPLSAGLWSKVGGRPVPDSRLEFYLPLRWGPVVEEVARRRGMREGMCRVAAGVARPLDLFLAPRGCRVLDQVEPCRDWDFLARTADEHRDPAVLTAERSAAYLRWRFAEGPDAHQTEVFRYRAGGNASGWFALRHWARGRRQQIRTCTVLDWVTPGSAVTLGHLLGTIIELRGSQTDLICMGGRSAVWSAGNGPKVRKRTLAWYPAFCTGRSVAGRPLAEMIDLVPADGDAYD